MELIQALCNAIRNRRTHHQRSYSCGTSCCIAGDKVIRDFPRLAEFLPDYSIGMPWVNSPIKHLSIGEQFAWDNPWNYAKRAFGIPESIAILVFDGEANVYSHTLGIFLLELNLIAGFSCEYWNDENNYNDLNYPFKELTVNHYPIDEERNLEDLLAYLCLLHKVSMPPITAQILRELFPKTAQSRVKLLQAV